MKCPPCDGHGYQTYDRRGRPVPCPDCYGRGEMPIFEYRCTFCGEVTEILRPASERDTPAECANCHCPAEFIISAPGLRPDGVYSFAPRGKEAA